MGTTATAGSTRTVHGGWTALSLGLVVSMLAGCGYISDAELKDRLDADNDGLVRSIDCDDSDPSTTVFQYFVDLDQDGYGDPDAKLVEACALRDGLSEVGGDCDDTRPLVNPEQPEICNQLDDDCNGRADDDVIDMRTFFQDGDGDGFGDPNDPVETCFPPEGYVSNDRDCDDSDSTTFGVSTWYADTDGDGWGDSRASVAACSAPEGSVARGGDCDDADATAHPDGVEVCDDAGIDEDCDGLVDDDDDDVELSGGQTVWPDLDGDGLGDAAAPNTRCAPDAALGWVDNRDDCDDTDPGILDEDCPYLSVSAGGTASCAIRGDLRISCWGDNSIALNQPAGTFIDVAVGLTHACGLNQEGTLSCWGDLGDDTFEAVDLLATVGVDGSYTCSLTEKGDLQCWYAGGEYRLGVAGQVFEDFEVGTTHGCGLLDTGDARCLGACDSGECAVPSDFWLDIAAGREFTCGIDEQSEVVCWGDHAATPPAGLFDTVRAFGRSVCASGVDGIPTCWSSNSAFPQVEPPLVALSSWDVGSAHGCGILESDRSLVCWGNDTFGQSSPPE